jgi:hypothetical protein
VSLVAGLGSLSWQFIKQTQPRIVKILDSFGSNPAAVKAASPQTKIIGRIYLTSQPTGGDPTAAAQAWWNTVSSTVLSSPGVECVPVTLAYFTLRLIAVALQLLGGLQRTRYWVCG